MKKILAILMAGIIGLSLCACSEPENTTPDTVDPDVLADIAEQNPLLINMGDKITINGTTYTAAMLYEHYSGTPGVRDEGAFVVNRITGCVYVYTNQRTSHGFKVTSWLDTGLRYEGTVDIAGIELQIPEAVNE